MVTPLSLSVHIFNTLVCVSVYVSGISGFKYSQHSSESIYDALFLYCQPSYVIYRQKAPQNRAYVLKFQGWGFLPGFNPKSDRESAYRIDLMLTLFSGYFRLVVGIIYLIIIYFFNVLFTSN